MEKAYIKAYKIGHNSRPDRYYEIDYTKDTQFCPLLLLEDYNPQYIDPEYGKDPYWFVELYDKENFQFRHDDYPPTHNEDGNEIVILNFPGPS